jgi:mRNA interferase RelE/StbE
LNIKFTKKAIDDLDTLEHSQPKYFKRILTKIQSLEDGPQAGKRLVGPLKGKYSFRVGDYRIIYKVDGSMILILTVNHRREVYK